MPDSVRGTEVLGGLGPPAGTWMMMMGVCQWGYAYAGEGWWSTALDNTGVYPDPPRPAPGLSRDALANLPGGLSSAQWPPNPTIEGLGALYTPLKGAIEDPL